MIQKMFTLKFPNSINENDEVSSKRASFLSNVVQDKKNLDFSLSDEKRRNSAFPTIDPIALESLKGVIKSMVTKSSFDNKIEEILSSSEWSSSDNESDYYDDESGKLSNFILLLTFLNRRWYP